MSPVAAALAPNQNSPCPAVTDGALSRQRAAATAPPLRTSAALVGADQGAVAAGAVGAKKPWVVFVSPDLPAKLPEGRRALLPQEGHLVEQPELVQQLLVRLEPVVHLRRVQEVGAGADAIGAQHKVHAHGGLKKPLFCRDKANLQFYLPARLRSQRTA